MQSVRRHGTGNSKIAETVMRTSKSKGLKILRMDSLQSAVSRDVSKGKSYLGVMESNLSVLKTALEKRN